MRHWWSAVALMAFGVCVIVLLSLIQPARPHTDSSGSGRFFVPIQSERLMDDGVADLIDPLPLSLRLSRVKWEPGILSVDLVLAPGNGPEALLGDAYELCRASFERVNNVRQLLVRFYAADGGHKTLLASADMRASDWVALNGSLRPGENVDDWAQSAKYRMNWTENGRKWLANFAFS